MVSDEGWCDFDIGGRNRSCSRRRQFSCSWKYFLSLATAHTVAQAELFPSASSVAKIMEFQLEGPKTTATSYMADITFPTAHDMLRLMFTEHEISVDATLLRRSLTLYSEDDSATFDDSRVKLTRRTRSFSFKR
jgi:hypothetical protein